MAGHAAVPKFGSWDAENIGYTVFFEKVRENKGAPVPAAPAPASKAFDDYDFDPYEHYENLSRNAPSRQASSHGHRDGHAPAPAHHRPQHHPTQAQRGNGYHRRNGSNGSSAASEASSRGSKFSPPKPYQPRYGNNNNYPAQQGGGHGAGAGAYAAPGPRHHHGAPRVAASPPRHVPPPARTKASAVPKFGVWDEQNAAAAAQGFTVQFEKVKRHREVARAAVPDVLPQLSPERVAPARRPRRKANKSFLSKMYRCLFPVVRE